MKIFHPGVIPRMSGTGNGHENICKVSIMPLNLSVRNELGCQACGWNLVLHHWSDVIIIID